MPENFRYILRQAFGSLLSFPVPSTRGGSRKDLCKQRGNYVPWAT